jgi:NTP pyrophosphatase (non-canonical NTP hydrolase)
MDVALYQTMASRTINPRLSSADLMMSAAFGLVGESGEVLDILKKYAYQGHPLDTVRLSDELGDVLFYCAMACTAVGLELRATLYTSCVAVDEESILPTFTSYAKSRQAADVLWYVRDEAGVRHFLFALLHAQSGLLPLQYPPHDDVVLRGHVAHVVAEMAAVVARLAMWAGLSLADVAQGNIAKLTARYPQGFTTQASMERVG